MATTRLTTNSQESSLGDLLAIGPGIYLIPFFQREYRWAPDKASNLLDDIRNVVDGLVDKHFLGAIIVHGRRSNPTDPKIFEVIDGQQRLTTAFLFVAAVVKILSEEGEYDEVAKIAQNYLQIGRDHKRSNLRIHSSRLDRSMMAAVIEDLRQDLKFREALVPYQLNALPAYGAHKGPIRNNYNRFKRYLKEEVGLGGIYRIRQIYEAFLNNFTVVQIDVIDPTDGPKIFDSLNSRQEPMKISDLVRNEIFRKISDDLPEKIERIDEEVWQPFYSSFEHDGVNHFEKYLFPFGLVCDINIRKSDVFINLRNQWNEIEDPVKIIESLNYYKLPFLDALLGSNQSQFPPEVAKRFRRIASLGAPSSLLPFSMQLGRAVMNSDIDSLAACNALDVIESFLVRRAVVGHEPTGLHAVFKRLWADVGDTLSAENVSVKISSHKTVAWPDDTEFREAIKSRPLYKSAITPFLLVEYDCSLGGDVNSEVETIEHVLPQNSGGDWKSYYGEKFVSSDVDALANLIPCTGKMNSSLGNQGYDLKKERFSKDSKFKSTRLFADENVHWNHDAFISRSEKIGSWAVQRFPYNRSLVSA